MSGSDASSRQVASCRVQEPEDLHRREVEREVLMKQMEDMQAHNRLLKENEEIKKAMAITKIKREKVQGDLAMKIVD